MISVNFAMYKSYCGFYCMLAYMQCTATTKYSSFFLLILACCFPIGFPDSDATGDYPCSQGLGP